MFFLTLLFIYLFFLYVSKYQVHRIRIAFAEDAVRDVITRFWFRRVILKTKQSIKTNRNTQYNRVCSPSPDGTNVPDSWTNGNIIRKTAPGVKRYRYGSTGAYFYFLKGPGAPSVGEAYRGRRRNARDVTEGRWRRRAPRNPDRPPLVRIVGGRRWYQATWVRYQNNCETFILFYQQWVRRGMVLKYFD